MAPQSKEVLIELDFDLLAFFLSGATWKIRRFPPPSSLTFTSRRKLDHHLLISAKYHLKRPLTAAHHIIFLIWTLILRLKRSKLKFFQFQRALKLRRFSLHHLKSHRLAKPRPRYETVKFSPELVGSVPKIGTNPGICKPANLKIKIKNRS